MRGYEATVQTEFDWIGDIPSVWSVPRLKYLTACLDGKRIPLNGEERSRMQGDVPYWGANAIMDYVSDYLFDEPLLLIGEDGAPFTIKGRDVAFESHGKVWPNNHIHVLRPNDNSLLSFLTYSMNSTDYANFVEGSTRQKLTQSALMNIPIALPPKHDVTQVVKFLDYETTKIDALIDEQKRLIELLKEKRQAVISHAVTKGLNPDAPMKDSGVEWLGKVPEHWKTIKLKHILSIPMTDGPHETPDFYESGVPFVSAEAVSQGVINFDKVRGYISRVDHERYSRKYSPKLGDVYMVKSGASTGTSAIVEDEREFNIWSPLAVMRTNQLCVPRYLLHAIRTSQFFEGVKLNWSFGTQQNIGMNVLENLWVPLPPIAEQIEIYKYLDNNLLKLDGLSKQAAGSEEILKERRSALISAAVTGKIDVRDWQPPEDADLIDSNAAVQMERQDG